MTSRKRVSVRQIELLVEFLEGHRDLAHGRLKSKEASALSSRLWAKCAGILNADADGHQRTAKQWNKWFTDYKRRLLSRIKQIKSNLSSTGGGPGIPVLLSSLEERLAALLGANTEVTGRSGTPQAEVQINPLSVERMMAVACQTMAEATNKMAEAALKSAEAQGRIAGALKNISKALQDKHARWSITPED